MSNDRVRLYSKQETVYHVAGFSSPMNAFREAAHLATDSHKSLKICWSGITVKVEPGYSEEKIDKIANDWDKNQQSFLIEKDKNHPAVCQQCQKG